MENQEKKHDYRVVTFLKRDDLDYLDELEKDIYFSSGIHIPRARLVEEIIEAFKEKKVTDKQAIEKELLQKFQDNK